MLQSPSHAVIASRDAAELAGHLQALGLLPTRRRTLDATSARRLYGVSSPIEELRLEAPGAQRGFVRLLTSTAGPRGGSPYDLRPLAIDLYTRDIEASLALAAGRGARCRPRVDYELGPLKVREAETVWTDGLVIVFLETNRRRPSLLDTDRERLHSEVHSIVWTVADVEKAQGTWRDRGGLQVLADAEIRGPIISRLLGLPKPEVPVRFSLLCDAEARPGRLELLQFLEDEGGRRPTWPLAAGLHAVGFTVTDLEAAMGSLGDCSFGEVATVETARAVTGLDPSGVRFELWEA